MVDGADLRICEGVYLSEVSVDVTIDAGLEAFEAEG
jgi:hypothetical protein